MESVGRGYLRRKVRDPVVRKQLTHAVTRSVASSPGFHNTYLSTYNRDNVHLVTEPIDKITPSAVATADGASHEVDVLVLATRFPCVGLRQHAPTFAVTGVGGLTLTKFWDEQRVQAYEGVSAIPGFPNLFSVMGPYGYRVGSSYFALIEAQTHHMVRCLEAGPSARRHPGRDLRGGQRPLFHRAVEPPTPPGVLAGQLPDGQQLLLRQERRRGAATRDHVRGLLAQ